jgi:hypothetical protein
MKTDSTAQYRLTLTKTSTFAPQKSVRAFLQGIFSVRSDNQNLRKVAAIFKIFVL